MRNIRCFVAPEVTTITSVGETKHLSLTLVYHSCFPWMPLYPFDSLPSWLAIHRLERHDILFLVQSLWSSHWLVTIN